MDNYQENQSSLFSVFESLDATIKHTIADIESPLLLGLVVLTIAEEQGQSKYLSAEEIVAALEAAGVAITQRKLVNAFSRAGDKISRKVVNGVTLFRVMTSGRRKVENYIASGSISVSYIEEGKPRTARKVLANLLNSLTGDVRICDPYYGLRTLDSLELIPSSCKVRFLTAQSNDNPSKLSRAISDYKRERPNTELRLYPDPKALHDRYILTESNLMIFGHGIKDIGNRESFVVVISAKYSRDLLETMNRNFSEKWLKSVPL